MIETIVKIHLKETLNLSVALEKPEKPSNRYILIEKTGSRDIGHIKRAVIAVQSYAESMYKAAAINEDVKAAMEVLPDYDNAVVSVILNSDYNYTDTSKKQYRYQAVFDIIYI